MSSLLSIHSFFLMIKRAISARFRHKGYAIISPFIHDTFVHNVYILGFSVSPLAPYDFFPFFHANSHINSGEHILCKLSVSLSFYFPFVFFFHRLLCLSGKSNWRRLKETKNGKMSKCALCVVSIVGTNFLINNKQITLFFGSAAVLCWRSFFFACVFFFFDKWILENIYIHKFYIRSVFVGWLCVCVFAEYFYGNSINISFFMYTDKKEIHQPNERRQTQGDNS